MGWDFEKHEPVPDPPIQDHFRSCLGAVKYKRGELSLPLVQPPKKKHRLSWMMAQVLVWIRDGKGTHYDCQGRSEHGEGGPGSSKPSCVMVTLTETSN